MIPSHDKRATDPLKDAVDKLIDKVESQTDKINTMNLEMGSLSTTMGMHVDQQVTQNEKTDALITRLFDRTEKNGNEVNTLKGKLSTTWFVTGGIGILLAVFAYVARGGK